MSVEVNPMPERGEAGILPVLFKTLAEADDIIVFEADSPVEREDLGIGASNLEVDLGAACGAKTSLGLGHQLSADPFPSVLRIHGEVVDPTAMSVITRHDRADDPALRLIVCNKEHLRLYLPFAADVATGIVPRNDQSALGPQLHNGLLIAWLKRSNLHLLLGFHRFLASPALRDCVTTQVKT